MDERLRSCSPPFASNWLETRDGAMLSEFDVYVLQDYVPVCIGTAQNLEGAEEIVKTHLSGQGEFLVYSQRTGVKVLYRRTAEGFVAYRSPKARIR